MKKNTLSKNKITQNLFVIFLITGNIGYGLDILEDFNNDKLIFDEQGIKLKKNSLSIINNGTISINDKKNLNDSAIIINNDNSNQTNNNILNNGIIKTSSLEIINGKTNERGNGISSLNPLKNNLIKKILNNGVIKGQSIMTFDNLINQIVILGNGNGISNRSEYGINSIENLKNNGIIEGAVIFKDIERAVIEGNGNGISNRSHSNNIGEINNTGIISGSSNSSRISDGNGISNFGNYMDSNNFIGNITNIGIIKGSQLKAGSSGGNGILNNNGGIIKSLNNKGIISGYHGNGISSSRILIFNNKGTISGYNTTYDNAGINVSELLLNFDNSGIIKGNNSAIKSQRIVSLTNNGILAGQNITNTTPLVTSIKNGIEIKLDSKGEIVNIANGSGGEVTLEDESKKTIINGKRYDKDNNITEIESSAKDSYTIANESYNNSIINGAGMNRGALVIEGGTSVDNSTVNGYNTAVYLEDNSQLSAANTIFNGGGLKNDIAVIKGSSGDNIASLLGTSIINGNTDLGNGNDRLTLDTTVQLNGKLDGGLGNDILNLGEAQTAKIIDSSKLNILHDINGFETINTNGDITLFETVKLTEAKEINLESGNLVLRIDPTVTVDGKITGHALYENKGILTSTGGNLVIGLNGIGENTTISMGKMTITPETNDSWWKDTDYIKTNSSILDGKLSEDGKDINITILDSIPLGPSTPVPPINPPIEPEPPTDSPIIIESFLYKSLNEIYRSIVESEEIGNLANTTLLEDKTFNESIDGLLALLDQIYANNPYAYTLKSSRDSLKLFEDNLSYLTIKPKKDEMIVQGKAIYTGVKNDSSSSEGGNNGFNTSHRSYKTTTNTVGGLATFEYGLSDDTSLGFIFGGNNQDVNFKGSSKIKGNSLYLGTFAKTDINNFKFMSGVGYQYTSTDADRRVSNRYDSFSTGDKYNVNSLNAFVEAKYVYSVEQDWTAEPKVRLSYYYIDQDKVNEGYTPGQISMKTDAANSNTADVEVAVDFVKSLYLNNGKLKNILSLGVINTIGDKSKELNGYILGKEKNGKKFDIQGVELPKTSGKVSYNLELEEINGMIYTAGVSLEFAKDYNRNVNATVGIAYKF